MQIRSIGQNITVFTEIRDIRSLDFNGVAVKRCARIDHAPLSRLPRPLTTGVMQGCLQSQNADAIRWDMRFKSGGIFGVAKLWRRRQHGQLILINALRQSYDVDTKAYALQRNCVHLRIVTTCRYILDHHTQKHSTRERQLCGQHNAFVTFAGARPIHN